MYFLMRPFPCPNVIVLDIFGSFYLIYVDEPEGLH